ncbi:MAG: hypothetical protein WA299_00820, partial [Candidatus Acidiferrum sp.]
MGWKLVIAAVGVIGVAVSARSWAQRTETAYTEPTGRNSAATYSSAATQASASESANAEAIAGLVGRLELERYKA